VLDIVDTCDDSSHFVSGENDWKSFRSLAVRDLFYDPIPLAGNGVKEPQGTHCLVELTPRRVEFIDHPELEVPDRGSPSRWPSARAAPIKGVRPL